MSERLSLLRSEVKLIPANPGIYRMLDAGNKLLYVGKAKNLQKRVSSYFSRSLSTRITSMVSQIHSIEFTITSTETEALLLESNLIKKHLPKYNILLRDDKSYPYIYISSQQQYPGIFFHRGNQRAKGAYYGPYTSAGAVRSTLNLLQKVFRVRQCNDSYFNNRTRPCLQYQINRCSAPCVDLIDPAAYRDDVDDSIAFLQGKSEDLIRKRVQRMEQASIELDFESAAKIRDQISLLRKITDQQYVSGGNGDSDVIYCLYETGIACIQLFTIRGGNSLGNKSFFPKIPDKEVKEAEILTAFLLQYYSKRIPPKDIIISHHPKDHLLVEQILSDKKQTKVTIRAKTRGERLKWLNIAAKNAKIHLHNRLNSKAGQQKKLEDIQQALDLRHPPEIIECFDISHSSGEATVASCVVFKNAMPSNSDYRRFNIKNVTAGDDYAAIRQVVERRYTRLLVEKKPIPDLIMIDGGKGQLREAEEVLAELALSRSDYKLIGVAKGSERKAGMETIFLTSSGESAILQPNSGALLLIQQIRDEAHRFAITDHRKKRQKTRTQSKLEDINGLGPKRRQALLTYFGGLQGISSASAEELSKVNGISSSMASKITDYFQ